MGEFVVRFVLGGVLVSIFAVIAEVFKPKTFAGIFGAAPSVALATLGLAFAKESRSYASTECETMVLGAVALAIYCTACVAVVRSTALPVWLGAGCCWLVWLVTSLSLWWLLGRGV